MLIYRGQYQLKLCECWFINSRDTIVIKCYLRIINHSEIGVMFTNETRFRLGASLCDTLSKKKKITQKNTLDIYIYVCMYFIYVYIYICILSLEIHVRFMAFLIESSETWPYLPWPHPAWPWRQPRQDAPANAHPTGPGRQLKNGEKNGDFTNKHRDSHGKFMGNSCT